MRVTAASRTRLRLDNLVFTVLFLGVVGLLAWLSIEYDYRADWTASGRNTLSAASIAVLERLDGPVTVTAFVAEDQALRDPIANLVGHYSRRKPDLRLAFVNPETEPQKVRDLGIRAGGELILEYRGRKEHLQKINEQTFTNALQRLARAGERHLVFLQGHGERSPEGKANFDLGEWGRHLRDQGLKVHELNLARTPAIPDNTSVLVIAGPRVELLPGEVRLLLDYLDRGGNLLWLVDPDEEAGLGSVAELLGIEVLDGTLVDPTAVQLFGAAFALGAEYGPHPITREMAVLTLFPRAAAIELGEAEDWQAQIFLESSPESWLETGSLDEAVGYDAGSDIQGPLVLGVALTRRPPDDGTAEPGRKPTEQRVVVMGDGDFLSNAYLGNGGNLDLGLNMVNWLSSDDTLIAIPARIAPDRQLSLSRERLAVLGIGFLVVLPALLIAMGVAIWWRRTRGKGA
jgi:ABC-type uncharacterized transport system involved in gliding motility auxiliary subunit